MILAEISFGDVLWSMLALFFFVIFLWMIFGIIGDVFRSDDLSGGMKAVWCLFILFFPWLAIFIYLVARGNGMAERALAANAKAQAQLQEYARQTGGAGGGSATEEIKAARDLLDSGAITQAEYEDLKAKALARA